MCLIITALCAVLSWLLCLIAPASARKLRLYVLALMYSGATIMWLCDGLWNLVHAEAFADLTANDALLGLFVAVLGLLVWAIVLLVKKPKHVLGN